MSFIHGHTYRLFSVAYPTLALNVYGTNAASTGRNVCLYDKDEDPNDIMQKWYVTRFSENDDYGFVMRSKVDNRFVLDRSDGSVSSSYNNNAHLCKETYTTALDYRVEPINVQGNIYRICLPGRNLYLTAANGNGVNPTSSIATEDQLTEANKNVYWAAGATTVGSTAYNKQCWTVVDLDAEEEEEEEEGGSSTENGQKLRMPINGTNILSASRTLDPDSSYAKDYSGRLHYGGDIACALGTELKGLGIGVVEEVGENTKEGNFVCVRYNNCIPVNNGTEEDIIVRYFHMDTVTVEKGDAVTTSVKLGTSGCSGDWAFNAKHVHVEVDHDTDYPNYTPSLTNNHSNGNLYAGEDSCYNPFDWFYCYEGQEKVRYSGSDETWVFPADMVEHTP